jgi:serine protease inhibitor
MVVVNAIYFKGNWETPFLPYFTRKSYFTKLDSSKTIVDMMNESPLKKVKYGENHDLDCKVLEIPYGGLELGMIVILPNTCSGLPALEKKLTVEILRSSLSNMDKMAVNVSIPKFKLEYSLQLKTVLSDLGMPDLFSESKADLSGMGKGLYVSEGYHKAFVDVNEEGKHTRDFYFF